MPRLSALGRPTLMGPGAGPLRCWLDLSRTIEQICDGAGCRLVTHDVDTGEIRIVDQRGANWLVAGYGVWAARLQDGSGYRDSYGHTHPDWIPIGVDASGAILVADYPSGRGLWLVRPDGSVEQLVDVLLDRTTDADLDGGVVVYRTDGDVVLWPTGEVYPARLVDIRYSAGWLVGAGPGGLWLCSWAQPERSWLLSTDGCDFHPDVQVLPGGQVVRVVSSRTAGEGDGDLRVYDVDVVGETIDGVPAAPRDIRTYVPPVVDEPLVDVPTIAPWPCRVSVFHDAGREAAHPLPVDVVNVFDRYTFFTIGRDDLSAATWAVQRTGLPLLAYQDGPAYRPEDVPDVPGVIPAVFGYPRIGTDGQLVSVADTVKQVRAVTVAMQARYPRVALVLADYRQISGDLVSYNWSAAHVVALFGALCALARELRVTDVCVFAWSRADGRDGVVSRADFALAFDRLLAAAQPVPDPGTTVPTPSTPAPETPAPPKKGRPVQQTDSITYQAAHDGLDPLVARASYGEGFLAGYRLMGEGTPLADVLAGRSAPTQAAWPKLAYAQAAPMAEAIRAARQMLGRGTGGQDGVLDAWRIFGPEHWPVAYVLADLAGGVLPAQPFADPF